MKLFVPQEIERYAAEYTSPLPPLLDELQRETINTMEDAQMLTGVVEGRLLQLLVKISGSRSVLEIGTYTGFSALMMAEGLPDNGELGLKQARFSHKLFNASS